MKLSKEKFEKADKSKMLSINTGVYYPSSGLSNSEIASLSRSMHKSQGFGNTGTRGNQNEYIELLKGEMPTDKNNLFEGIDTTWNRVEGGAEIKMVLDKVEKEFNFLDPSASIPDLLTAYSLINILENEHWRNFKLEQIKEIIAACAGLYLEGKSNSAYATKNDSVKINIEAINRSDQLLFLLSSSTTSYSASTTSSSSFFSPVSVGVCEVCSPDGPESCPAADLDAASLYIDSDIL